MQLAEGKERSLNVTNWITAIVAVAALVLSIYNVYIQRKNRLPSLRLTMDFRDDSPGGPQSIDALSERIYSCRVVNQGSVPTQVREVRLCFENGRSLLFPQSEIAKELLFENEYCFLPSITRYGRDEGVLPVTLQPFESVRFAAWATDLRRWLLSYNFREDAEFRFGVVDSLDKVHMAHAPAEVDLAPPSVEDAPPF